MNDQQRKSSRATRIKACELAAQCMAGHLHDGNVAGRLMALVVFFENYIDEGAEETEHKMHLLAKRRTKRLQVIAGGNLG